MRLLSSLGLALALAWIFVPRPAAAQKSTDDLVEITGEIEVVVADDFERGRSEHHVYLRDRAGGRTFRLHLGEEAGPGSRDPADRGAPRFQGRELRTGMKVRVRGRRTDHALVVTGIEEVPSEGPPEGLPTGSLQSATEERRAIVLIVDLADASASDDVTLEAISNYMYTGSRSVDGLFLEASYGQLGLDPDSDGDGFVDVFGPFQVALPAAQCDYYGWAEAADAAASAAGHDLALYQHRVYVLPPYWELACGWAGLGNVGCDTFCRSWIAEPHSPMVYAHELGHNLELAHAAHDPDNDGVVDWEYGDLSDPMGISRAWHVFNGPHTAQLGWIGAWSGDLVNVDRSGVYELHPINVDPLADPGPRALRIAKPDSGDFYYVSFRQPNGYDDSLDPLYTRGVSIHRYRGSGYALTYFIDSLTDGVLFEDAGAGVGIRQLGVAPGGGHVEVEITVPVVPVYHAFDGLPSQWIDASDGTPLTLSDDSSTEVPIGFPFSFYGVQQETLRVSSNGYLTFGDDGSPYVNAGIPSSVPPNGIIAPFWDDLNPSEGGAVYYRLDGAPPTRRLTVAWVDVPFYGSSQAVSLEVVLYEGSNRIRFDYRSIAPGDAQHDGGASATVGVEGPQGSYGLEYSFDEAVLYDETAIVIEPPRRRCGLVGIEGPICFALVLARRRWNRQRRP
jgi:hypothetical protein